jgi:hypothetical protein
MINTRPKRRYYSSRRRKAKLSAAAPKDSHLMVSEKIKGERFKLAPDDVAAFKRRRYQ